MAIFLKSSFKIKLFRKLLISSLNKMATNTNTLALEDKNINKSCHITLKILEDQCLMIRLH